MRSRDRIRGVLLGTLVIVGCNRDGADIEEAVRRSPSASAVPQSAIGGGVDETTGLPVGYPEQMPLVPGGRAVSGGVDPGVVRTATLLYEGMTADAYRDALDAAMRERGQRIVSDDASPTGARRLRVDLGGRRATVILTDDGDRVRVDIMMLDPPSNR